MGEARNFAGSRTEALTDTGQVADTQRHEYSRHKNQLATGWKKASQNFPVIETLGHNFRQKP
jgi:hypothetical protein